MSTDEENLLGAILEHPDDDARRLVCADWYEEHGLPERAELVRVQLELDGLCEDHPRRPDLVEREQELLQAHGERWTAHLPRAHRKKASFRRGFPFHLRLTARQYLRQGRELRRSLPFDGLDLRDAGGRLGEVIRKGLLGGLRWLDVSSGALTQDDVLALAHTPQAEGLRHLDLSTRDEVSEDAWRALVRSPHLAGLRGLEASWTTPGLLRVLAEPGATMRLEHFQAVDAGITAEDVQALAGSPAAEGLRDLGLSFNPVGVEGVEAIARSRHLRRLRWLSLWGTELTNKAVAALARSPNLASVEVLGLSHNELTGQAMKALAGSEHAGNLLLLQVEEVPIGNEGLGALVRSERLAKLTALEAGDAGVDGKGVVALARSPLLGRLSRIDLWGNTHVGDEAVRALVEKPACAGLRLLRLGHCGLGDDSARAIAESPHLTGLRSLHLARNKIGPKGAEAMAQSPHLRSVTDLWLFDNKVGDAGARAFLASPHAGRWYRLRVSDNRISKAVQAELRKALGKRAEV